MKRRLIVRQCAQRRRADGKKRGRGDKKKPAAIMGGNDESSGGRERGSIGVRGISAKNLNPRARVGLGGSRQKVVWRTRLCRWYPSLESEGGWMGR